MVLWSSIRTAEPSVLRKSRRDRNQITRWWGLCFYDNNVVEIAASLKPSPPRGLEMTDVNSEYLFRGELQVQLFDRSFVWLDTGTHESLLEARIFVETIEKRQGQKVAYIEEIAYRIGYINSEQLQRLAELLKNNEYGEYLLGVVGEVSL